MRDSISRNIQPPNTPLVTAALFGAASFVLQSVFLEIVAYAAAWYWAFLEAAYGTTGLRKVMGVIALVFLAFAGYRFVR